MASTTFDFSTTGAGQDSSALVLAAGEVCRARFSEMRGAIAWFAITRNGVETLYNITNPQMDYVAAFEGDSVKLRANVANGGQVAGILESVS